MGCGASKAEAPAPKAAASPPPQPALAPVPAPEPTVAPTAAETVPLLTPEPAEDVIAPPDSEVQPLVVENRPQPSAAASAAATEPAAAASEELVAEPSAQADSPAAAESTAETTAPAAITAPPIAAAPGDALKHKVVVFEVADGPDKGREGFRMDTLPICDHLRQLGWDAEVVFYTHARRDNIFKHVLATADAYVHRIATGALPNEAPYIQLLRNLVQNGVTPLPHPDVLLDFASKETLAKLQGRMKAAPDTQAYYSMAELRAMFPQMLATGERTLSVGDGDTWRVRTVQEVVGGVAPLDTMVQSTNTNEYKASDEAQTLEQFMRDCETHLQYGPIVDERRLETAQRMELVRVLFVNAMPVAVSSLPPNGGQAKSEAMLAGPQGMATPPEYAALVDALLMDLPAMLQKLTIAALPLLWTADVWLGRRGGQRVWTLKALECNCVGFTHHLELAALVAREIVAQVAEHKVALKRRVGVLEAVSSTDPPSAAGPFRKDTVPLCEALMSQGWAAEVAFYTPERKAAIVTHLAATVDIVVNRVAPGVLDDATDEGYRGLLVELAAAGLMCLPAPGKPLLHSENAVDGDFVDFSGKPMLARTVASNVRNYVIDALGGRKCVPLPKSLQQLLGTHPPPVVKILLPPPPEHVDVALQLADSPERLHVSLAAPGPVHQIQLVLSPRASSSNEERVEVALVTPRDDDDTGSVQVTITPQKAQAQDDNQEYMEVALITPRHHDAQQSPEQRVGLSLDLPKLPLSVVLTPHATPRRTPRLPYPPPTKTYAGVKAFREHLPQTVAAGARLLRSVPAGEPVWHLVLSAGQDDDNEFVASPAETLVDATDLVSGDTQTMTLEMFMHQCGRYFDDAVATVAGLTDELCPDGTGVDALVSLERNAFDGPAPVAGPLVPQPESPVGCLIVLECRGGVDKGLDGHRLDTVPLCNALIHRGWSARPAYYSDLEYDEVKRQLLRCDGVLVRTRRPTRHGSDGGDGVTRERLEQLLREVSAAGTVVMNDPEAVAAMTAPDAIVRLHSLACGMPTASAYSDVASFEKRFPAAVMQGTRVLHAPTFNATRDGEGIWIVNARGMMTAVERAERFPVVETDEVDEADELTLYSGGERLGTVEEGMEGGSVEATEAAAEPGEEGAHPKANEVAVEPEVQRLDATLVLVEVQEAVSVSGRAASATPRGGKRELPLDQFMRHCRQYLSDSALLLDTPFLPHVMQGTFRAYMIGSQPMKVVHTKPADTAVLAAYEPDAREVEALVASLDADLPALMPALGLPDVPAPLLWTVELVLGDADDRTRYHYTALDAHCVSVDEHPELYPAFADGLIARCVKTALLSPRGAAAAAAAAAAVATTTTEAFTAAAATAAAAADAVSAVSEKSSAPKQHGTVVVLECAGGPDKGADGHAEGSVELCAELVTAGWAASLMTYADATRDVVKLQLLTCDAVVVKAAADAGAAGYDGVTSTRLEPMLEQVKESGVSIVRSSRIVVTAEAVMAAGQRAARKADVAVLRAQPTAPAGRMIVLECRGGADKQIDGHRVDTVPLCNELIAQGWAAWPLYYSDATAAAVQAALVAADGVIVRVREGGYPGVSAVKLAAMLADVVKAGTPVLGTPQTAAKLGAKDTLVTLKELSLGMPDVKTYCDVAAFDAGFPAALATGARVLRPSLGSRGEGVWRVQATGSAPGEPPERSSTIRVQEAVDSFQHVEELPMCDFMKRCYQYLAADGVGTGGGDGAPRLLMDVAYLPLVAKGELRVTMVGTTPAEVVRMGHAPVGLTAAYAPDAAEVAPAVRQLTEALPQVLTELGLSAGELPVVWCAWLIEGTDGRPHLSKLRGSCVDVAPSLYAPVAAAAVARCATQSEV